MVLVDVRQQSETAFPTSLTRKGIIDGLSAMIVKLNEADIVGSLWLDGSFLTEKITPRMSITCYAYRRTSMTVTPRSVPS